MSIRQKIFALRSIFEMSNEGNADSDLSQKIDTILENYDDDFPWDWHCLKNQLPTSYCILWFQQITKKSKRSNTYLEVLNEADSSCL